MSVVQNTTSSNSAEHVKTAGSSPSETKRRRLQYLRKELENVKLLGKLAIHFGVKAWFWSLADGLTRRVGLGGVYERTHFKRHECCKAYLRKKYGYIIEKYKNLDFDSPSIAPIGLDCPIYTFWFQGAEELPYPIDLCLDSISRNSGSYKYVFLDGLNYGSYVQLPDFVERKFRKGSISVAHFSDFLRIALLREHGGIWLDSTLYVLEKLPKAIGGETLYSINAGADRSWVVSKDRWSVCLLAANANHPLISFCYDFLYEYWKKESVAIAYLLLDCIIAIGYEDIPEFKDAIDDIPLNNKNAFKMLEPLRNEPCSERAFDSLRDNTYLMKLTYKQSYELFENGRPTYFKRMIDA